MSTTKPKNIPIDELSQRARSVVESTISKHPSINAADLEFSFLPDPGIIGFILQDDALKNVKAVELSALADDIASGLGDFASGANAVALIDKGGATTGHFPIDGLRN